MRVGGTRRCQRHRRIARRPDGQTGTREGCLSTNRFAVAGYSPAEVLTFHLITLGLSREK